MKTVLLAVVLFFSGLSQPATAQIITIQPREWHYEVDGDVAAVAMTIRKVKKGYEVTGTYQYINKKNSFRTCQIRGSYYPSSGTIKCTCEDMLDPEVDLPLNGTRIAGGDGFKLQ